ncbi:HAUS augmin-like complex subunit 1 [Strongylocentrotus purpuratus]|uniref:HAUS augmin-like complex subunit 1 n=1 Tax=Strongylocentrotus purpuratus TaxID=7668 RepID=A0A7M7LL96_STRPU|nr:HAUS augmin-like complex subunit 1 [Strongylocentrotus purpuratus]|eukprot:XP_003725805.1 PREDICTED: HAUS augmin-like complex subunit 1 [Strongylocentrotus purpuratus]
MADNHEVKEKHREVRCWLEEVFGDHTVPQYEINVKMVVMLHDLMQRCKERDTDKQILIDDLNDKTTEYHGEEKRLSSIVENVGLSPSSLSQSGNVSLRTLTNVAQTLQLQVTSASNYYLAMMNLTRELVALEDKRQEENLSNQKLFNKTKIAMIKTESLKKAMVSLEEQAKEEGPKLEDRMRQTGFYHSKSREYDNQLESLEVKLRETGVEPSLYHQSLVALSQELESLDTRLSPLKAKLDSYQNLPPNVPLAKVKIEEAKRQLMAMEAELSRNIDMMHM